MIPRMARKNARPITTLIVVDPELFWIPDVATWGKLKLRVSDSFAVHFERGGIFETDRNYFERA